MDVIEQFLHRIAYKFPKGYPDMNDAQDILILENEFNSLNITISELETTKHWNQRLGERGNILDILNFPTDSPISKEQIISTIEEELQFRCKKLENLKNLPLSLTSHIGYKILKPVLKYGNKTIQLQLKVKYLGKKGIEKESIGNTYVAVVKGNELVTLLLSPTDSTLDIETAMKAHSERNDTSKKSKLPIKILNPTNLEFVISETPTTTQSNIDSGELPYKLRTDYRKGADFEHKQYGTGKIVDSSAGSGGKGDSRGHLDWVDVDFGKPGYVSGGVFKTVRRIPNIYTLVSPIIQNQPIQEAKQIGDIYHFTDLETLANMHRTTNRIELDSTYSSNAANEYYSFTRDPNIRTLGDDKHQIKIKLNGDKMSNKYKFEPYVDVSSGEDEFSYGKNTPNFEAEERISSKYGKIDLTPYIEEIAIIDENHFLEYLEQNWSSTKYYDEVKQNYYDTISWIKSLNIPLKFIASNITSRHRILDKNITK